MANMLCETFRNQLELYIDGELGDNDRLEFLGHLENCSDCKKVFDEAMAIQKAMKNLALEKTPDNFVPDIIEKIKNDPPQKRKWTTGGKIAAGIAACALVCVIIVASTTGGKSQSNTQSYGGTTADMSRASYDSGTGNSVSYDLYNASSEESIESMPMPTQAITIENEAAGTLTAGEAASAEFGQKIIKNGYIYLNSIDFDADVAAIENMVASAGGYAQYTSISGQPLYGTNNYYGRYGYYTYRIPSGQYDGVVEQLKQVASLESYSENADDITSQYYDTQARLDSYQLQYNTIQALLEKAETLEDVLTIQKELSNLQYLIDSLTGTLKQWDFLTNYSTLQVTMQEVADPTLIKTVDISLGARVKESFIQSINRLIDNLESFVVWLAGSALAIIIIAVVIAVAIILILRKRKKSRKIKKS